MRNMLDSRNVRLTNICPFSACLFLLEVLGRKTVISYSTVINLYHDKPHGHYWMPQHTSWKTNVEELIYLCAIKRAIVFKTIPIYRESCHLLKRGNLKWPAKTVTFYLSIIQIE